MPASVLFSSISPYFMCRYNHLHSAATIATNLRTTKSYLTRYPTVCRKRRKAIVIKLFEYASAKWKKLTSYGFLSQIKTRNFSSFYLREKSISDVFWSSDWSRKIEGSGYKFLILAIQRGNYILRYNLQQKKVTILAIFCQFHRECMLKDCYESSDP